MTDETRRRHELDALDLPILLERAWHGRNVTIPRHLRRVAVAQLTAAGMSGRIIGERFGLTRRTIQRWRAAA